MASSLHEWESDPLFSAAEVVQDSADRMEAIFRLLLHEQSLVQGDHPDPKLLASIEYHKRDLATILETAKWQLEDFERVVNSLATADKSQAREGVISRHRRHFVMAIKEQINHVEKSLAGPFAGDSVKKFEWVSLNEKDRDGLALFLTGGIPAKNGNHYDMDDSSILRRFLDSTPASSSKDDEIVELGSREFMKGKMNGDAHVDHYAAYEGDGKRNMSSHHSTNLGSNVNSVQEIPYRSGDGDCWDLEANETASKSFFQENKLQGFYSRMKIYAPLSTLWTIHGRCGSKNYTKRLKDGEEQRHSPRYVDASNSLQRQRIGQMLESGSRSFRGLYSRVQANAMHMGSHLGARYQTFPCHVEVNRHSVQKIFGAISALIFLGTTLLAVILVSRVA